MPIELRHLRYFVAVADELHFGRAAERLGMSQPPLSQQIRQLEDEMDVRLFLRDSRRVALTEAGRAFLTEARAILARVDEAVEQARRAQRGETGELRIGMTRATPLSPQIPAAIFAFRRQSPAVHLHLLEMNTLQQIDALLDHRLDLGIIRKRALPEALASQALFRDPLAVVLREDHPALASLEPQHPALPLRLLAQEPFVTFDRSAGAGIHDQVIALCSRAGFTPRIAQEAREPSTIIGLVSAGLGVSILPASCEHIRVEGVRFVPLADRDAASDVHVAYRRDEHSARVRRFVELLRANAAGR